MANGQTVSEIIASTDIARNQLAALERALQEDIDKIRFDAFRDNRRLIAEELQQLKELRAQKAEARQVFMDLVFFTLQRLNRSDEITRLQQKMNEINEGLRDDLEDLKRIERHAATAAKIADALAKATEKLASLAAGSPIG